MLWNFSEKSSVSRPLRYLVLVSSVVQTVRDVSKYPSLAARHCHPKKIGGGFYHCGDLDSAKNPQRGESKRGEKPLGESTVRLGGLNAMVMEFLG